MTSFGCAVFVNPKDYTVCSFSFPVESLPELVFPSCNLATVVAVAPVAAEAETAVAVALAVLWTGQLRRQSRCDRIAVKLAARWSDTFCTCWKI